MNNKILIPGVALGAVLIALAFVVAPVQEATAVHTTVQANAMRHFIATVVVSPDAGTDDGVDESGLWTFSQPFHMVAASATFSADTGNDCNLDVSNIRTDLFPEAGTVETDGAAINAATDTQVLVHNPVTTQTQVIGNSVLSISLLEGANCDTDSRATINALIKTTGALTAAPTATIITVPAALGSGLAAD